MRISDYLKPAKPDGVLLTKRVGGRPASSYRGARRLAAKLAYRAAKRAS